MLAPEEHTPPALPVCQQEKEPVRAAAGGMAKPTQRAFSTDWTLNLETRASPLRPKEDRIDLWFQSLESLHQCRLTFSGRTRWPVFSAVRLHAFRRSHRNEQAGMSLEVSSCGDKTCAALPDPADLLSTFNYFTPGIRIQFDLVQCQRTNVLFGVYLRAHLFPHLRKPNWAQINVPVPVRLSVNANNVKLSSTYFPAISCLDTLRCHQHKAARVIVSFCVLLEKERGCFQVIREDSENTKRWKTVDFSIVPYPRQNGVEQKFHFFPAFFFPYWFMGLFLRLYEILARLHIKFYGLFALIYITSKIVPLPFYMVFSK